MALATSTKKKNISGKKEVNRIKTNYACVNVCLVVVLVAVMVAALNTQHVNQ
jgi:uncharacterized membrane protein